jgi:hypothetical protein
MGFHGHNYLKYIFFYPKYSSITYLFMAVGCTISPLKTYGYVNSNQISAIAAKKYTFLIYSLQPRQEFCQIPRTPFYCHRVSIFAVCIHH